MFNLKTVFSSSAQQKVWYKVSKTKDTEKCYDIFFVASNTEALSPFICVRVIGVPQKEDKFFTDTPGIKELKLKETELNSIFLDSCSFQYWFVSAAAGIDADTAIAAILEREKKDIGYFEVKESRTSVAHLPSTIFSDLFIAHDSMILKSKDEIDAILVENNMADRLNDEIEWKPEDGPTSYKPLLLRLIRAEALKAMSARHPAFMTELPFCYGNFHKGYPVVFCKQNDIFFGTIDNTGMTNSEAGGKTAASISGIVSIRDALKLSSTTLLQLSGEEGLTLGFDFVNPVAVKLDKGRRFDWRRCIVLDQSKIDTVLPSEEVLLSDIIGLGYDTYDWAADLTNDVPGAMDFIVDQLGRNRKPYVEKYTRVSSESFKKYITVKTVASWEPFMRVDDKLFSDEIYNVYVSRLKERVNSTVSAPLIKRLMDINEELINMWDTQFLFSLDNIMSADAVPYIYGASPVNMSDTVLTDWDKLNAEYEALLSLLFTDMPGMIDKETEWLYRVTPACSGLSEASVDDYSDLRMPRQIFSDNYGDDKIYDEETSPELMTPVLKPLSRALLKEGVDVYNAAKAIVDFIDSIRNNVKPYVIRKQVNDPVETINVKGGQNV